MSDNFVPFIKQNGKQSFAPFVFMMENDGNISNASSGSKLEYNKLALEEAYEKGRSEALNYFAEKQDILVKEIAQFLSRAQQQIDFDCVFLARAIKDHISSVANSLNLFASITEEDLLSRISEFLDKLRHMQIRAIKLHIDTESLWKNISEKTGIIVEPHEESNVSDITIVYEDGFLEDKIADRIKLFKDYFDDLAA